MSQRRPASESSPFPLIDRVSETRCPIVHIPSGPNSGSSVRINVYPWFHCISKLVSNRSWVARQPRLAP